MKKVLGLDSLRKKHGKFEQQRALLHRFDVFMADDRVLPMLCKALGKNFFATKKQPIPVQLTRKTSLPLVIMQSLRSTFWYLSEGTCLTVKAGSTGMTIQQIVENVEAICDVVPNKIPRRWANVRSISLKTTHSMALPIYNKTPAELQEIAKLAGIEDEVYVAKPTKPEMISKPIPKERALKSPLVRALKKQQEEISRSQETSEHVNESPKKKRKVDVDQEQSTTNSSKKAKGLESVETLLTPSKSKDSSWASNKSNSLQKEAKSQPIDAIEETPEKKGVQREGMIDPSSKKKSKTQVSSQTTKSPNAVMEKSPKDITSSLKKSQLEVKTTETNSNKKSVETPKANESVKRGGRNDTSSKKEPNAMESSQASKSPSGVTETSSNDTASSLKESHLEVKTTETNSNKKGLETPKSNESVKRGGLNDNSSKKKHKTQGSSQTAKSPSAVTEKSSKESSSSLKTSHLAVKMSDTSSKKKGLETPKANEAFAETKASNEKSSMKKPNKTTSSLVSEKTKGSPNEKASTTINTPEGDKAKSLLSISKKGESFIPSKKFTGSKSGYVFKSGSKGIGYYVDAKPKVDPQVLEALLRSFPSSRGGAGSGRKAKKTGRGRR